MASKLWLLLFYVLLASEFSYGKTTANGNLPGSENDAQTENSEVKEHNDNKNDDEDISRIEESADLFEGDIAIDDHVRKLLEGKLSDTVNGQKWPGGLLWYKLHGNLRTRAKNAIAAAMRHISSKTCIRFKKASRARRAYVEFFQGKGCWSQVGYKGRKQRISIGRGCETMGIAAHEILHALGFWHEQSRKDRDKWVTIMWNNIINSSDKKHNFKKHVKSLSLGAPYDYFSIMHYGRRAFSKNGKNTIVPKMHWATIGQRRGLSPIDIWQVKKRYGCPRTSKRPPKNYPIIGIRLVNGRSHTEGRVEVLYKNRWGPVCDDLFDINDAHVACRQLKFEGGALSVHCCSKFGKGRGRIWLDNLQCKGSEISLAECNHPGWGKHNCRSHEHVGVRCRSNRRYVRLVGGMLPNMGRVEIYHGGRWGTVCDDFWDRKDGDVVCTMLGYPRAATVKRSAYFGQGRGPIWLDNVHCRGNEKSLQHCRHNGWGVTNCKHREDAGVICQPRTPARVFLVGGRGRHEGRVLVLHNGVWGTVCDDFWDRKDADVVCHMLGYGGAAVYRTRRFGPGKGRILLDNVQCRGHERNLADCHSNPWGKHNCKHSEDVGIVCKLGCRVKTVHGKCCVFPFVYKGRVYRSCARVNHNRPWCSLTSNYDKYKTWGNCAGACRIKTVNAKCCVFPFIYKGRIYRSCTRVNHNRPWCSLSSNFDKHKSWGNCAGGCYVKTLKGKCCVFPFTYKGRIYHSCTRVNHNRNWCSLSSDFDKFKSWGNCGRVSG